MISDGAYIDPTATIVGYSAAAPRRIHIGYGAYIGPGCKIAADEVFIGEYTTIHRNTLIAGGAPARIGHACWIGEGVILNAADELRLGNGVGVGAGSQLWTHIKHGDVLQGCRWNSTSPLVAGDDAWLVGHCLVSPVVIGERSMAMLGSVVTKDMAPGRCYAGTPARDITDRVGEPYLERSLDQRYADLMRLFEEFAQVSPEHAPHVRIERDETLSGPSESGETVFTVATRSYRPIRTEAEVAFMRFLLSRTVKFFPLQG